MTIPHVTYSLHFRYGGSFPVNVVRLYVRKAKDNFCELPPISSSSQRQRSDFASHFRSRLPTSLGSISSHKSKTRQVRQALDKLSTKMPGKKVTAKAVVAAGEAAEKVNPTKQVAKKGAEPAAGVGAAPASKNMQKKQAHSAPPKKEVEYVVYKVGDDQQKRKAPLVHKAKKNDVAMLEKSLADSAVARAAQGKNVKKLAPKKQPILPHHHGGKPATKPVAAQSE